MPCPGATATTATSSISSPPGSGSPGAIQTRDLTPAIAAAADALAPDSLLALRLPSALAAAGIVLLTGMLAGELGGARRAQLIAAACAAVATIVLATGHLLSTATFDLLAWTGGHVARRASGAYR